MITTAGKNYLPDLLVGASSGTLLYIGVGFGTTPENVTDTILEAEAYRGVASYTILDNTITFSLIVPPGSATGDVTEAGVFTQASGGVLYDRKTFPVQSKANGDTLIITWNEILG